MSLWYWHAPHDAYISAVHWQGLGHRPGNNVAGNTTYFAGIGNILAGWSAVSEWGGQAHWNYHQPTSPDHTWSQMAMTGLITKGNGARSLGGYSRLDGATVYLNDDFNPAASLHQHSHMAGGDNKTSWLDSNATPPWFRLHLGDRGLGLWEYSVLRADNGANLTGAPRYGCVGNSIIRCPNLQDSGNLYYWQHALPEGVTPARAIVKDINERVGYSPTWYLRIDRTPPSIDIPQAPWIDGQTLMVPSVRLDITATDGAFWSGQAHERSGVTRVRVTVDGNVRHDQSWGCDTSCQRIVHFDLLPARTRSRRR